MSDEAVAAVEPAQEQANLVLAHYLAGAISLSRAAELLHLPWLDLRTPFLRLDIPLRTAPQDADEIAADLENAAGYGSASSWRGLFSSRRRQSATVQAAWTLQRVDLVVRTVPECATRPAEAWTPVDGQGELADETLNGNEIYLDKTGVLLLPQLASACFLSLAGGLGPWRPTTAAGRPTCHDRVARQWVEVTKIRFGRLAAEVTAAGFHPSILYTRLQYLYKYLTTRASGGRFTSVAHDYQHSTSAGTVGTLRSILQMGFILSSLSLSPYLPVYSTLLVSGVTVLASLIFPIIHREHLARNQALAPVTVDHASGL